jgi:hypothetical protein
VLNCWRYDMPTMLELSVRLGILLRRKCCDIVDDC